LQRRPRAHRPISEYQQARLSLDVHVAAEEAVRVEKVEEYKSDPVEFFRQILGFKPFKYQADLIRFFEQNQFIAAR
jgi:hypothetical protein